MLALLKKSASSDKKETSTPWRADFRNVETLPDTKTVRTTFLLNAFAFTALGSIILYSAYREITLSDLKREIISVEQQIAAAVGPNTEAENKFKAFQAEEKKLKDIQSLALSTFSFPDYLNHLASLMPEGVKASNIDYRGEGQSILVTGSVAGLDANSSATASAFIKTLQEDEKFKKIFSSVSNSNLNRNVGTNSLNLELVFTFAKPAGAK